MEADFYSSFYTTRGQGKINKSTQTFLVDPNLYSLFKSKAVEFIRTVKAKLYW